MTGVVLCFILIGGGALVGQVAKRRGRSFILWSAVATSFSIVTYLAVSALAADPMASSTATTAAVFAMFLAPVLVLAVLAAFVQGMGVRTRKGRWTVFVLGGDGRTGECELVVGQHEVRLPGACGVPEVIPLSSVDGARADCECVRLAWRDGDEVRELVLQIVLPDAEWEVRAKLAEQAARAIGRARLANASGPDAAVPRAQATSRY